MRDSSSNINQFSSSTGVTNISTKNNNDLHLLESLFDNLAIGLYRTSVNGTILYSNAALVKLLGFESFIELQERDLEIEGYGSNTSRQTFKKLIEENNEVVGFESCWKRKDGSEIFVRENAKAIMNDEGDIIFYEGTVEDITERKKVEKALKSQISFNSKLINHSPVFFVAINAMGETVMMNETMLNATGYKKIEVVGRNYLEMFVPESDREMLSKVFEQIIKHSDNTLNENHILTKDERELLVEWHGTPMFKDDGAFDFFIGLGINITERQDVEEALRKSEERYKSLFNNATVGIYQSTPEGKLLMANPALLAIYGYSSFEELSGINTSEVYFNPGERDRFKRIIDSEGTVYGYETKGKKADGSEFYFLDSARAITDKDGKTVYYEGVVQDITEQKVAEAEIQHQNKFLNSIIESLSHPFYVINALDYTIAMGNAASGYNATKKNLACHSLTHNCDEPCTNKEHPCPLEIIKKTKKPAIADHIHFDKNGNARNVEVHGYPIFDENGNITQIIEYCLDITERKQAELKLEESERKFRRLIEHAPDGIFRLDTMGNFILANDKTCEMLGYSKSEIYNINIIDTYVSIEEKEKGRNRLAQLEPGSNFRFQRLMLRKDGTTIPVEATATGLEDGSQAIIHDITRRKRTEFLQSAVYQISEATENANTLNDLYKSVHKIIDSVLPAKNFFISLYDSENDLLTFPYFVDEVDSLPGLIKAGKGYTAYVLRTGKSVFYDVELDRRLKEKGEVETVGTDSPSWLGVPLIVDSKTIGAMVVQHYTDPNAYTENDLYLLEYVSSQIAKAIVSKRAEEELRKLSSAVKQSSASIVITDTQGNIEYVNPKFTDFTGYKPEEVKGKNTRIMKSGETPREVYDELWATIKEGETWKGELQNKKKNGELYWESASISPIRDSDGKITHFLAVKEDITEKKRIQKELIESKEKAEEMSRLKSTFLANMSHELRTPLVGILGYAEIIHNEITDPDQKDMTDTIITSGKRLMNTLNSILDLSKVESEKNEVKLTPVEIPSIVKESIKLFKVEADRKKLILECSAGNDNVTSLLDESLLKQILDNLLSNAIKYTETGSIKVCIDTDKKMNRVILKVIDSGIGISTQHQKVIFEEFRQVSEGLDRRYEGTGLGLTITKKFVELMNGDINLESELGKGSKFTITFPLVVYSPIDKDIAGAS